ncbi:hypothetical protein NIES3974_12340 [Calothrix sp. NIES-3974]|nr:hypothetical protein NIES3974_12340 [Calothrix sp. NIES-3974]
MYVLSMGKQYSLMIHDIGNTHRDHLTSIHTPNPQHPYSRSNGLSPKKQSVKGKKPPLNRPRENPITSTWSFNFPICVTGSLI